ncbi:transcription initiation factor IIF, beta subunit [Hesseltinella vesiculosa]|uniref:Transcription initiation factor IIF subunit beta n=1 Tax=Hesseltinella vesiculosa TaxID=101127 RepID=A0A1X2GIE9_9FUNG|nr:transcription initiation factor IIF, beta subunit [Hesseltinella vesiculosa]
MADDQSVDAVFEDDPGSLDDIDDDLEDLNMDDLNTKIWLVKVPKFLASKWSDMEQDDVNLGSVRIYKDTPEDIPKEYTVKILPEEVKNRYIFTQANNGRMFLHFCRTMRGKVHHDCTATPSQFGTYRNIMRKRAYDAEIPQRSVRILDQDNQPVFVPGASANIPSTGFSDFVVSVGKRKTDKEKATRLPRNELMDVLFAAFDRYPYWSFKGILEHTHQPAQYLKEVLSEICVLNKRGPYAGNYQLKSEFKHRESQAEQEGVEKAKQSGSNDDANEEDSDDDNIDDDDMEEIQY